MKRRGAVLLMTLMLIMIITAGISLLLSHNTKTLSLYQKSLMDANTNKLYLDLKDHLPKLLSRIKTPQDLDYALMLPHTGESDDHRFTYEATFYSLHGRLNINHFADLNGTLHPDYKGVLENLFIRYPVAHPEIFIHLISDTLDSDKEQRHEKSEIALDDPDFLNGKIESMQQFHRLIERYIAITNDKQILDIPWERIIGFRGEQMDINYVSSEVLSVIIPELSRDIVTLITQLRTAPFQSKEELISIAPEFANHYDQWFKTYASDKNYFLKGEILFRRSEAIGRFSFEIDLKNNEFTHFKRIQ